MFVFLEPWHPCSDKRFEDELRREVGTQHVLHGMEAKIIARRQDLDDFLYALPDGRYANVHLTWSKETNPSWPDTEIYDSQAAMEQAVQAHIEEWNELESS